MTNENTRFRFLGLAAAASILAVSAALTSCAARPDRVTTSSVPDDYRTRHPITLAEVQHSLDIPVGTGERKLTTPLRDLVRGFAQDYLALSSSTVSVALPASSVNAGAAHAVRSEVRQVLIDAGVKPNRIVMTTYDPAQASASSRYTNVPDRRSAAAMTGTSCAPSSTVSKSSAIGARPSRTPNTPRR